MHIGYTSYVKVLPFRPWQGRRIHWFIKTSSLSSIDPDTHLQQIVDVALNLDPRKIHDGWALPREV
jgi:hypothetical protein